MLIEFLCCIRFSLDQPSEEQQYFRSFIGHPCWSMTILEYLSLYASAAKWGDWQCIPGLWEHLQRMWDFHRWRHGGSCTPWDAWRCGDRQRNRGHTTWPWRWRDKVSTFSTHNRDSTKLSWWIYIWFIKKSLFLYHFLYIWYWWYFLFLKSPVVKHLDVDV